MSITTAILKRRLPKVMACNFHLRSHFKLSTEIWLAAVNLKYYFTCQGISVGKRSNRITSFELKERPRPSVSREFGIHQNFFMEVSLSRTASNICPNGPCDFPQQPLLRTFSTGHIIEYKNIFRPLCPE